MHKAAEDYVKNDVPLPKSFDYLQGMLDKLKQKAGDKYTEYKMAVTNERTPCDWSAPEAWMRGIADLLIINKEKKRALVLDYKTGSDRYADTNQLRLMALLTFAHFPEVDVVKGALLFVLKNRLVSYRLERKDADNDQGWLNPSIAGTIAELYSAQDSNVFTPSPTGLCRFCPVSTCEYA